ncbi:MAG: nicotinate-nucleotide--dimethylbenzimidazole phosphoribosyltransferase [Actinomycetota bacterium]
MPESALARLLVNLPGPDTVSQAAVAERAATTLRPAGAFARLDAVAAWLAAWQWTTTPRVRTPHVAVFGADHGVAADGVSAYPAEVTGAMVAAMGQGVATVTALAAQVGASFSFHDAGVGRPTGNIRTTDAMTVEEFDAAVQVGVEAVENVEADLLVFGEVGIANTTPAAAVSAAVLGGPPGDWAGPGTGVGGDALAAKRRVVEDAVARVGEVEPIEALRRLGGKELAATAGATLAARHRGIPVLLDGFIATAAVLPLHAAEPAALDHVRAGHSSAEPGHVRQLAALGLDPLLSLDLRLGEGSGAVAAIPIVQVACAAVVDVATFEEFGLA